MKQFFFLPYRGTKADLADPSNGLGYVFSIESFCSLLEGLLTMSPAEVAATRTRIIALHDSHYTPAGGMHQVWRWFQNPDDQSKFDVRCPGHANFATVSL